MWLADLAFKIDFRFWIVALRLMSARQFLIYLVPFTAFFVIALHLICGIFVTWDVVAGATTQAAFQANRMGAKCITPWLSPGRLQCYSADAITPFVPHPPRNALSQKGPICHGKNQGDQPRRRARRRRDDPDHLAIHQGQADQPLP
ncbi:MAG: hypothetical protein P4M05_10290 [Bradyrhizobium sp.]|nr:hypothetical protein [Bradyrhizobium sp.]